MLARFYRTRWDSGERRASASCVTQTLKKVELLVFVVPLAAVAIRTVMRFLAADEVDELLRWFAGAALSVAGLLMELLRD